MNAPTIRSSHHGLERILRTQASEVFQSSWTSWSSKIIADGTVDKSHLVVGSFQESQYRRVYSSKSATSSPGGSFGSRREWISLGCPRRPRQRRLGPLGATRRQATPVLARVAS